MSTRPTLAQIASVFTLIGATAFGGQPALMALLNRELVERRGWLQENDINEAFTYTKLLPGPVVVQVVAYLGWKLRRGMGVIIATLTFLFPSLLTMLALAILYRRIASLAGVTAALSGLTAAVIGIIVVATGKQGLKTVTDRVGILIAVIVCAAALYWEVNPALLVGGAGLLGIVREAIKPASSKEEGAKT